MIYDKSTISFVEIPRRVKDLTGTPFNRLTVLGYAGKNNSDATMWWCECICGNITRVATSFINAKITESCGCYRAEKVREALYIHGKSHNYQYRAWRSMKTRCLNKNAKNFHNYGKRGIVICQGWMDFPTFASDIGERPTPKHSFDRPENEMGYWCGHCDECIEHGWIRNGCWSTMREQIRNRRVSLNITFRNETKALIDWCEELHIPYSRTQKRLLAGWTPERAFLTPPLPPKQRGRLQGGSSRLLSVPEI